MKKTLTQILARGALAFAVPALSAIAADATTSFADAGVMRCQVCGAQYRVKTTEVRDNGIRLTLVPVANRENTR